MGKKSQRVKSFKENLKRMLLVYSLVPVFQLMVLCIAIVRCVGGLFISIRNRKTNEENGLAVEKT